MYRNFRAREGASDHDGGRERGGRPASIESKRIFNAGRAAGSGRARPILKDCYVASVGNVTGVTGGVTLGDEPMIRSPEGGVALPEMGQNKRDTEPYIQPNSMIDKSYINHASKSL